ncbi:MAG: ABC transporter permease subunit, partial [Candidatus Acidiferrum sp.]
MRLYSGTTKSLIEDSTYNRIAAKLKDAFFLEFRYQPAVAEVNSWNNSLRAISQVFQTASLLDHGVLLENQLPLTSKRLDCLVTIIVLLLMAPVFSAGSITIEKEQRTLSSLLTSLLTAPQIWWGKFVAALLFLLLLLSSALPLLAVPFAFGGVEPQQMIRSTASTVLVLAAICAVGLWCSATFRRSIHSTAACYGIVLVLSVVTAVVFGILISHWTSNNIAVGRADGPPAYVQAPLFLNPLYPLLSMMDDPDFRQFIYPASSWMLFAALGCLA